jgi:hypothetical protein
MTQTQNITAALVRKSHAAPHGQVMKRQNAARLSRCAELAESMGNTQGRDWFLDRALNQLGGK